MSFIGAGRTPFSTRMRHGFLLADVADPGSETATRDWTRDMWVGPEGRMTNGVVTSDDARRGCIAFGPYFCLLPGTYEIKLALDVYLYDEFAECHAVVETVIADDVRSSTNVTFTKGGRLHIRLPLVVIAQDFVDLIQIRVYRVADASFGVQSVQVGPEGFDPDSADTLSAPEIASTDAQGLIAKLLSIFQIRTKSPNERRLDA